MRPRLPVGAAMSQPESLDPSTTAAATPRDKDARETSTGCRERADADTARSLDMDTANGRAIFEKSAASWTKRADMLHRIETGIEARHAAQPVAHPDEVE